MCPDGEEPDLVGFQEWPCGRGDVLADICIVLLFILSYVY